MKGKIAALLVLLAGPAVAQQHQHGTSPYAGFAQREVKALSDQQLSDLRAGRGMGLALPAELNGYPGPLHVLELAAQLQLSTDQHRRLKQFYEAMKAEAISVGEKLIAQETALDRSFKERSITPQRLVELTAWVGATQGELRAVHLKYHLTAAEVLTADQKQRYAQLRGYH